MTKKIYYTSDFNFDLPPDLIASYPLEQRDSARMLVVKPKTETTEDGSVVETLKLKDKIVRHFISFLKRGDVVVFNNSRVVPVRFMADGYEITLHTRIRNGDWWGVTRKFKKIKVGDMLTLDDGTKIEVIKKRDDSGLLLHFHCDDAFEVLEHVGKMPLPPYIKRQQEIEDRERYQTVYADHLGSMAAPTAGLHFTEELMQKIENAGAKVVKVTLHVGAGTWMPVKTEDISKHKMHREWCCITPAQARTINSAKRVIAIGTTSLRTLEFAGIKARQYYKRHQVPKRLHKRVIPIAQTTDIFITPGYKFQVVDVLLTNFHLPKSTLFMLVSAFSGLDNMQAAYKHAIKEKYRFFSYGDCCLLYKKDVS